MKRQAPLILIVVALCALAIGLAFYKVRTYEIPFFPGEKVASWLVEARIDFYTDGRPVKIELALPKELLERGIKNEAASIGFGSHALQKNGHPVHVWSGSGDQVKRGSQAVYYRIHAREDHLDQLKPSIGAEVPSIEPISFPNSSVSYAAKRILRECQETSADNLTFVKALQEKLTWHVGSNGTLRLLKRSYQEDHGVSWMQALVLDLLTQANIPARKAYGVVLNESPGSLPPLPMVEYYNNEEHTWEAIETCGPREDGRVMVWARGDSLFDVYGAENSDIRFTAIRDIAPVEASERLASSQWWIATIAKLPASERGAFRYIALIPVGAFVLVFLRNLIGLKTLGTFMPVLLSLAFLELPLIAALIMFSLILFTGLSFRSYLTKLNLLVVPRVAACVVIVTILMMALGLLSYDIGATSGLRVTVFPMVVLAWTIERMSILWDEEGPKEAMLQIAGSLIAAFLAYLLMRIRTIGYWAQFFPELLLILLAGILILGRYTGYRLSEFFRFRNFAQNAQ